MKSISIKKFFFINIATIFVSFFIIDIILSNTLLNLKKKSCVRFEPYYYELKKSCSGKDKFKSSFPTVNIYTDEQGLRIKKNKIRTNNEKVYLFGASFTFGVGLEYEKTTAGILEKRHSNYEFYNFALGSYSPTVYLYQLINQIKKKQIPKKVILFVSLADIYNEGNRWIDYDNNGKPYLATDYIYKVNRKKEKFLHKNFRISRSFAHAINYQLRIFRSKIRSNINNKNQIKTSIQAGFTYRPLEDLKPYYEGNIFKDGEIKLKKRIKEISKISKSNNIEFYLVVFPFAETLEYGQDKFNWENYGEEMCNIDNCNFVNAFNIFERERENNKNWNSDLFFVGDEHYNYGGNKLLAEILSQKIFK